MKSKINISLLIIMISSSFMVNAQHDESFEKTIMLVAAKEAVKNDNSLVENMIIQNNNNLIQIQQIGNYNYSDVNVRSNAVSMEVNQFGDNNYTNVYRNTYDLNENVFQAGNNNFISDFSVYSPDPVNTSFNQQGNNLTIISNGSNSISKNLQINQSGNSGTVYIYNR